jgi:hypothetical protein
MDGYENLIKSKSWVAIKDAERAVFAAQRAMEHEGFSSDYVYAARLELTTAENNLRAHFKSAAIQS